MENPTVEGHALNAYVFCPRRCYYEYVEKTFYHNVYTMHGKLLHEHVDHVGRETRGEREGYRSVFLYSEKYGLSIRCDLIEEEQGQIYPVEYKRGKAADWENNVLQVCAQALALEEYLRKQVDFGYLFFYGSHQRKKVIFDEEIRRRTIEVIGLIRELYLSDNPPAGIDDWKKCCKCSLVDYCLPRERRQLRGKIRWERFI
jgi:CRISPR-associated exonuclease Cas4